MGCSARKRSVERRLCEEPLRRAFERIDRVAKPSRRFTKIESIARPHSVHGVAQFVDVATDNLAAIEGNLARNQIDRLDAVGAFVDCGDARIAKMLRGTGFFHIAHAAVDLYTERRHFYADVRRKSLRYGGQERCPV